MSMPASGFPGFVEFRSKDVTKTKAFFAELLDWQFETVSLPGSTYTFAKRPEDHAPIAAVATDPRGAHPLVYFTVSNVRRTTDRAKQLGARLEIDCLEIGGMGIMSVIIDPTGARVALWQVIPTEGETAK